MNIYIGNLHFDTNEDELKEVFSSYGEVSSVHIIKDKFTGRGKGFGFVEMEDEDAANTAIKEVNESMLNERKIVVNVAKPPQKRNNY